MAQSLGEFDYVIVGAGSAGCVLANRLSADPDVSVLLVEAGGKDTYPWIHIPIGYYYTFDNPRTDWRFRTEPVEGLNGRSLVYPRGRVLGGTSSINGMVYVRGHAHDYDHWRQLGNTGWGWDDVLPYFKRSEDNLRGADAFHGTGGELRIEDIRASWEILDGFLDAADQVGLRRIADFNSGENEGCSRFQVTQRAGFRASTAKAFLKPARGRPNLRVVTHAQVSRIQIVDKRATGVSLSHHGETAYAAARGEVILAAGAIGSPQLLQLSGVGPGTLLKSYGIEIAQALPGVGENLQDHLALRTMFKVRHTRTMNEQAGSLWGRGAMALEYLLFRRGPMSIPPAVVGAFARSDPRVEMPDLQYFIYPFSFDKVGDPPHPFPAITASVAHLRPESRGTVRIGDADPTAAPRIDPNYLSAPGDCRVAAQALRLTRRIFAAPAMTRFEPEEFKPGPLYQTDEELVEAARSIGSTIFHPVGTCKMGEDDMAVVDARLRVAGIAGLRVVDASIMPTITSGNTNAPTIMIGEKAADMIRADRRMAGGFAAATRSRRSMA